MGLFDFNIFYFAAQNILAGTSIYFNAQPGTAIPFPEALLFVPLAIFPEWLAYLIYLITSIGLVIYFMRWRSIWALLSFTVLFGLFVGQVDLPFTFLVMLIGPLAAPLIIAKLPIGFVVGPWLIRTFGWRGIIKSCVSGGLFLLLCFIVRPTWLGEWITALRGFGDYTVRDSSIFFLFTVQEKPLSFILAGVAFIAALFIKDQRRSAALTSIFQPYSNIYSASMVSRWFGPIEFVISWIVCFLTGGYIFHGAPMFLVVIPLLFNHPLRTIAERRRVKAGAGLQTKTAPIDQPKH